MCAAISKSNLIWCFGLNWIELSGSQFGSSFKYLSGVTKPDLVAN
jgi:hypothetical protein